MTVSTLAIMGDSLAVLPTSASTTDSTGEGGRGVWPELIADELGNVSGLGPLLSSGYLGVGQEVAFPGLSLLWSYGGSWTNVLSSDQFDVLPYGKGKYSAAGSTATLTFTRPTRWRTAVGVAIYFVDYTSGGSWQYRINGGTWTNHGQTTANNNKIRKFYISGAVDTLDFRAYDGASSVGCFPAAVELFWYAPSTTTGLIVHDYAIGGQTLNTGVASTSGDRLAVLDAIQLGTGSPPSSTPNSGTLLEHINDIVGVNNTTTWGTDLTTLNTRASPLGTVGFLNPYECVTVGVRTAQRQADYRSQTKTSAAGFGTPAKVLDIFDLYSANGLGAQGAQNATLTSLAYLFDGTHQARIGHLDQATRIYWWLRTNFFASTVAQPSSIPFSAKQAAVAYSANQAAVAYSARVPLLTP